MIIEIVDNALEVLKSEFEHHPMRFYSETDIVCRLYDLLVDDLGPYRSKDNKEHLLIHTEYPTPFRCSMKDFKFEIKNDSDRSNGRLYRRGHYDLVVLNPDFIKMNTSEVIRGQNYELTTENKRNNFSIGNKIILYAIEILHRRIPLKTQSSLDYIKKLINQDYQKLQQSEDIQEKHSLVFVHEVDKKLIPKFDDIKNQKKITFVMPSENQIQLL